MIASILALAIAQKSTAQVIEIPDLGAGHVTVVGVLKLPELDPLGRASADVLSRVIVSDNDRYTKSGMRDLCIAGGQPRCYVMPDHMSIQLSVLPADTVTGVRMLAAMVSATRMKLEVMNDYLTSEPYRHKPVWSMSLDHQDRAWDRLRATDITTLYKWVFRPDNITVAVGGDVRPGQAQAAWNDATRLWRRQITTPLRKSEPFKDFAKNFTSHVLELRGPEFLPNDPAFSAKLLALIALGGGKSSALFMNVREQKALSYRQEGVLWPTRDGFVPRLLVQMRPMPREQEQERLAEIRTTLLTDIEGWDDAILARAQGFGGSMAVNGVDFSPLYFRPSAPLGMSTEDHTLLAAYWYMKSGRRWDGEALAEQFRSVDLTAIKTEATNMVKVAFPVIHPTIKSNG